MSQCVASQALSPERQLKKKISVSLCLLGQKIYIAESQFLSLPMSYAENKMSSFSIMQWVGDTQDFLSTDLQEGRE